MNTPWSYPDFDAHEALHFVTDAKSGLRAIIALHSTHLGPAAGGTRMWHYADDADALTDALRLSRGMSYKNAMAGLPLGGGKAVVLADANRTKTPEMLAAFDTIEALTYTSTTKAETVCKWCPINCTRTFIDVQLPGAKGRPWSKVPLAEGWERVISGNSCPKGLVEDVNELREVKAKLEEVKRDYPNVAEMVRKDAFRRPRAESGAVAG